MQWKSILRGDQKLASISSPGRRGRPTKASLPPNCLVEMDGNTVSGSTEYAEALAKVEVEKTKSDAAKQQVEAQTRALSAAHHQLRCTVESNRTLEQHLTNLRQRREEAEIEILARRDYGEEVPRKLTIERQRVKELLKLCASLREAQEGLSTSMAAEESKAVVLRRSKARLETD